MLAGSGLQPLCHPYPMTGGAACHELGGRTLRTTAFCNTSMIGYCSKRHPVFIFFDYIEQRFAVVIAAAGI